MCAVDFGVVAANKNKGQSMEKDGEAAEQLGSSRLKLTREKNNKGNNHTSTRRWNQSTSMEKTKSKKDIFTCFQGFQAEKRG